MGGAGPAEFLGLQEGRDHLRQRRECLPHSLGLEDPWAEGEGGCLQQRHSSIRVTKVKAREEEEGHQGSITLLLMKRGLKGKNLWRWQVWGGNLKLR